MNEYFFANYRLLMDDGIANNDLIKKRFANLTTPLPYTHTFTWRLGDVDELEEKRTWAQGCPVAYDYGLFTLHETDGGWASVSNLFYELYYGEEAKSVVLCSRDYRDITVWATERSFEIKRNRQVLDMHSQPFFPLFLNICSACRAGMVLQSGLPLHASMVEKDGFGVLFLGPSGRGKSTQAKLWKNYLGADFPIDDGPIMRKVDGQWIGFGMPWVGPHDAIYRQVSVPVKALVWLEQAKENRIVPMNPVQAMGVMLKQAMIMMPVWDDAAMDVATTMMGIAAQELPIFHLRCLPNEAAARLTYETICKL